MNMNENKLKTYDAENVQTADPLNDAANRLFGLPYLFPYQRLVVANILEAAMKFKQGFGRLMRRSSDSGVVAILNTRLIKKQFS